MTDDDPQEPANPARKRRPRYRGRNPRRFHEKYKELAPERYEAEQRKVLQSGRTPAGTHRPIMVAEVLEALRPGPGEIAVDATLGYGGHARAVLERIQPGGRLIGIDVDPLELPRTEARLRAAGYGADAFLAKRSNFAGLPQVLASAEIDGADLLCADLGVSSMQLDDPARGFTYKDRGPLDMRMNPSRGEPASQFLSRVSAERLARALAENADEPYAREIAAALHGRVVETTQDLRRAVGESLTALRPRLPEEEIERSIRRTFQALRIEINDEFAALDSFLRNLPECLRPGGRVAILSFHSGEDRRVKQAFQAGLRAGRYSAAADDVIRATPEERRANPRSASAKLRWAVRSPR